MNSSLYNPKEFKDNSGFGLIAHLHGYASYGLLQEAIKSLTCMTHRGGIAADGKTGDGCGLLLQMPDQFMCQAAYDSFAVELTECFAVGMVFFSQNHDQAVHSRNTLNQALENSGMTVVGWRDVPVNKACQPHRQSHDATY